MPLRLLWPTNSPNIGQPFGVNWTGNPTFYSQYGLPGHEGIDFEAHDGDEIFASADGTISRISLDGNRDVINLPYGNQIRIRHLVDDGDYETVYAHLMKIREGLKVGDSVRAGELIGIADHTGHVTPPNAQGAHLHFMLKKKGASQRGETYFPRDVMDPTPFLVPLTVTQSIRAGRVAPEPDQPEPNQPGAPEPEPPLNGTELVGPPPIPEAFNGRYRLQPEEAQFRRAWAWAAGGSGNQRWLNLIATPAAPYSTPQQRNATPDPQCIELAVQYLNPDTMPKGTPRYWPAGQGVTFCNIFANDATRVLHCEVPNNPANTSVSQMFGWLEANGAAMGWRRTTDGEEAQTWVNGGHVAIMIWSKKIKRDHVALVRPGQGRVDQGFYWPRIAQAGTIVSMDLDSSLSFGTLPRESLFLYLHD